MFFKTYDNVPVSLGTTTDSAKAIFANSASISINQELQPKIFLDDHLVSFAGSGDIDFVANTPQTLLMGDFEGFGYPIPESIKNIPSGSEINFPNSKKLFVSGDAVSGDYYINVYSTGNFTLSGGIESQYGVALNPIRNYATDNPIEGKLNLEFYFDSGDIQSFFDITGLLTPEQYPPVNEEKVTGSFGDWKFNNAYLESISFSIAPYQPVTTSASFSIYGSLEYDKDFSDNLINSHDLTGQKTAPQGAASSVEGLNSLSNDYYALQLSYEVTANREASFEIPKASEKDTESGEIPSRVSKNQIIKKVSIDGNKINDYLNINGTRASLNVKLSDMGYQSFSDNYAGDLISFNCDGVVDSQNLRVSEGGVLNGQISIVEHYR